MKTGFRALARKGFRAVKRCTKVRDAVRRQMGKPSEEEEPRKLHDRDQAHAGRRIDWQF